MSPQSSRVPLFSVYIITLNFPHVSDLVMFGTVGEKKFMSTRYIKDHNYLHQTVCCSSVNMAFNAAVHLHSARFVLGIATVSDARRTSTETYFGPAVIGSSEPDPEALRLGLRSECFPTTKRQPGESVIKSLNAHLRRYSQAVSDLLIGQGEEGVYIRRSEPLPTVKLDIPSVLGPAKDWDDFTAPLHRQILYFLATS